MARRNSFDEAAAGFRAHLPDLNSPRFTVAAKQNIYEYTRCMQDNRAPPWLYDLTKTWEKLLAEPYTGVTNDGTVREGLFSAESGSVDVGSATKKAEELLGSLDEEQKEKLSYAIDAREWRAWSNPEFILRPFGLRLEEVAEPTAQSILSVIESSLSSEGYQKALAAMRINHFLGEAVQLPNIMNQYSYNFLLFGTPHLTLTPSFTGAEPNIIDAGPWTGTQILHQEANLGLTLMQALTSDQQQTAQIHQSLRDPAMKQKYANSHHDASQAHELVTDSWGPDDQRHHCGAFRDNRVVPYAGLCASSLSAAGVRQLLALCAEFLLYHPPAARALKLQQIERHLEETYFAWIGGYGNGDAFYFRVQSPVVLLEFDHHSGVFLTNKEPAKYHTHTICRTPNAGDYGQAVREEGERLE